MVKDKQQSLDHLVYEGKTFQVEFYFDEKGKMQAFDYFEGMTENDQARFFAVTTHIANSSVNTIHPKTLYNVEDSKAGIYAIKPSQHRFFNFTTPDRRLVLTNAYKKGSQKLNAIGRRALKTAKKAKKDYESRTKEGDYYEES